MIDNTRLISFLILLALLLLASPFLQAQEGVKVAAIQVLESTESIGDFERETSGSFSRDFNLQTNPLGVISKQYNLAFALGISKRVTLGMKASQYQNTDDGLVLDAINGYEVGMRTSIQLTGEERLSRGFALRPTLYYARLGSKPGPLNQNRSYQRIDGPVLEPMVVYQEFMDSGFNVEAGAGARGYMQKEKKPEKRDFEKAQLAVSPAVEINVGWAF